MPDSPEMYSRPEPGAPLVVYIGLALSGPARVERGRVGLGIVPEGTPSENASEHGPVVALSPAAARDVAAQLLEAANIAEQGSGERRE